MSDGRRCCHWIGNYPRSICRECIAEDTIDPDVAKTAISAWGNYMNPEQRARLERLVNAHERKYMPHVHRVVYFKTPAEHNRALLEGAVRCLTQFAERNPGHFSMTVNGAISLVNDLLSIARDEAGA